MEDSSAKKVVNFAAATEKKYAPTIASSHEVVFAKIESKNKTRKKTLRKTKPVVGKPIVVPRYQVFFHPDVHFRSFSSSSSLILQKDPATKNEISIKPPLVSSTIVEQSWGQHNMEFWNSGEERYFSTPGFIGKGLFLAKNCAQSHIHFKKYPFKQTIIRMCGKFTKTTNMNRVFFGGVYSNSVQCRIPHWLVAALTALAKIPSPNIVLHPFHQVPHAVTPFFPLLDGVSICSFKGETLQVLKSINLLNPVEESWAKECGFFIPPSVQFNPKTYRSLEFQYRKQILNKKLVSDWDKIEIRPDQYIVFEITDKAMDLHNFKLSCPIVTLAYEKYCAYIPFSCFVLSEDTFNLVGAKEKEKGKKWQCSRHQKLLRVPEDCQTCFPPSLQSKDAYLWYLQLSINREGAAPMSTIKQRTDKNKRRRRKIINQNTKITKTLDSGNNETKKKKSIKPTNEMSF